MKRLVLCIMVLILLAGCATGKRTSAVPSQETGPAHDILEEKVPHIYTRYMGKPYRFGADPDKSPCTDCSHLIGAITRRALEDSDYEFAPYYSHSPDILKNSFTIDRKEVKPGDLIFFKKDKSNINHSGLITKLQDEVIFFVHASSSQGVTVTSTASQSWEHYWKKRFHSFRRWKSLVFRTKAPKALKTKGKSR